MASEQAVNKKIGRTIAKKRKATDLTQEEVAEHLGIGTEAFSRIERGLVSPGILKLYELADLFDCGVETFLVEGSRRPSDQAAYIDQMLARNSVLDRQLIVSMVEKLSNHLSNKKGRTTKSDFLI
jgi:transcriptional regulator with XRE-family HTH domain